MRKTNQLLLALLLMFAGAMNVSAGERVELSKDMWHTYDGFGADAVETGSFAAAWLFDTADGCPIGDTSCNAWADLGNYTKLYVNMEGCDADGNPNDSNPRIFINRLVTEGQFNANKADANCLVIPNAGTWAEDYYTRDGNDYVIDLAKIKKDFGFVHFHSIKGSSWNTKAIVHTIEAEMLSPEAQVGWCSIINNGNLEGEDVSSFFQSLDATNNAGYEPAVIEDGAGVDNSRGIVVQSLDDPAEAWATQFFIRLNEPVAEGTKWRISFDYKADHVAVWGGGVHHEPREYFNGALFATEPAFSTDWQTYTADGTMDAAHAGVQSIAFDLNNDKVANNYYFDNIKFEIFRIGVYAQFSGDVILLNFGFDTNLPEMVKESGAKRIIFDSSCVTVKVNGQEVAIYSVEACDDGRFYIFTEEEIDDNAVVELTFTNSLNISYTDGANAGSPVDNFNGIVTYNEEVQDEGLYQEPYPYAYVTPTLMSSNPEEGSFNLSSSTPINLVFDKPVDCSKIEVTANGSALTVSPASGFAKEITASGSLPNGKCEIVVTKVYGEEIMADEIFGEFTFTISVGQSSFDPNDQMAELIAPEYFANCAAGGIPEGFFVMFGQEERPGGTSYGSGPRMFNFAEGGDFTKGLYFREGYAEYGSTEGYDLYLEAGKKYVISFNSAMWKASGSTLDLKIFSKDNTDDALLTQTVQNKPDVNGGTGAVNGSTKTSIEFIPEATGNYIVRWDRPGFNEVLIANVKVTYMPDIPGLEYIMLLNNALESAKSTLAANESDRYQGEAYNALQAAISKYEGEMGSYTNPSQFQDAAAALEAVENALKDHRANCDEYDTLIKKAIDIVRQNEMPDGDPSKATKFTKHELFAQLKALVAKYHGSSQWQNMNEDPEGEAQWQLFYEYDVLTDDAQIAAAVAELKDIVNTTSLLFTIGNSAPENANGGKATGVAVLIERLRLGAEALKGLPGVSETDADIVAANNALFDDDALAAKLQYRIKARVYNDLNKEQPTVFQEIVNEETLETTTEPVDMTVYVKNPNVYKLSDNADFTDESVPGWITPDGFNRPGLTPGWGAWQGSSEIAQDAMFQTWGGSYRVEQTLVDLPVGIYTVRFAYGERNNGDAGVFEDSYSFVYGSDGEIIQSSFIDVSSNGEDMYIPGIGQAFPFASSDNQCAIISDIAVSDGQLTIGVNAGPKSHTFFNEVRVLMTAPLPGYVYPKLPETLKGDVNGDGSVDVADISAVITHMAGTADYGIAADVNSDGSVDVADISNIITIMAENARRLAGLPVIDEE